MSALPVSSTGQALHGHAAIVDPGTPKDDAALTTSHPSTTGTRGSASDPGHHNAQRGLSTADATGTAELANLKMRLRSAIRQYPDFPRQGILFEDVLPIFASPALFSDLVTALDLLVVEKLPKRPDVIVGLESKGFLFGPSLALRLGSAFVPVRKKGKLPGPVVTGAYEKEYGKDQFEMQIGSLKKGQSVLIVDDLIATGGSAGCAGYLVKELGGVPVGYLFLIELAFLRGRSKLDAPCYALL